LLIRENNGGDARVTWVRLSDNGMNAMRGYLAEAPGAISAQGEATAAALCE
jgi:hypothetical protein